MIKNSNYSLDTKGEKLVNKFLLKNYYPRLKSSGDLLDYESISSNTDLQKRGVDMILTDGEGNLLNYDLKAAVAYINRQMPTFAFEINTIGEANGRRLLRTGWLVDDTLETNVYSVINVFGLPKKDSEGNLLLGYGYLRQASSEDICRVEIINIEKSRLREYLDSKGLTAEVLMSYANVMRKNGIQKKELIPGVKLCLSLHLREQPCCAVISKNILLELCESAYIVKRSGISPLQNKSTTKKGQYHEL